MILADYVSTTEFACNDDGDLRYEFPESRKLTLYQGIDGETVATVDTSTYSSTTDKTTVTITSELLTDNLVAVRTGATDRTSVGEHGHTGPNDGGWIAPTSGSGGASNEQVAYVAAETLSGHVAVALDDDGELIKADNTETSHMGRVIGVTTQAISIGATGYVQTYGSLTEPTWTWTMGSPVYLSAVGALTQTPPSTGFSLKIGIPEDATTLFIRIGEPIQLA